MSLSPLKSASIENQGRVLVVDDEVELTNALVEILTKQGYETIGFSNSNQALETLRNQKFDVLLADLMMPEINGITLIKAALEVDETLICILMTGQGTVQTAVEAMKSGAYDYVLKPFKLNTILTALHHSMDIRRLRMENVQLRELVKIYELGRSIAIRLDVGGILQQTCEAAQQFCGADEASAMMPADGEDELMIIATCSEKREHLIGQSVPVTGTVSGWVAQNREVMINEGRLSATLFPASYPRDEIRASLSLPMMLGEKVVGVINVNHTRQPASFTPGQVKGLEILTHIAAAAMENARLYEQKEKQLRRVAALRTIDLAISSSLDLRVTLEIVLDQVTTQLATEAAAILLVNQQSQLMEYAAGRGFQTNLAEQMQTFVGLGFIGAAALDRRTISVPDLAHVSSDPLIETLRSVETIQSVFATPLIAKGEVKGVLTEAVGQPQRPVLVRLKVMAEKCDAAAQKEGSTGAAWLAEALLESLGKANPPAILTYADRILRTWRRDGRDRTHPFDRDTVQVPLPPEVATFQAATGRLPLRDQMELVIRTIHEHHLTAGYLKPFWEEWVRRDKKRSDLTWLNWAIQGRFPEEKPSEGKALSGLDQLKRNAELALLKEQ